MKFKELLFLAIFPSLLISCHRADTAVETIDIAGYQENAMADFDISLFPSRTVELRSEDLSILANPVKVVNYSDKLFVLNDNLRSQNVLVYSIEGDFISRLGANGRGPGEYLSVTDLTVDSDGNIWIVDGVANKLIKYNKELAYESTSGFPFEIEGLSNVSDGFLVGLALWDEEYPSSGVILVDKNMRMIKNIVPRPQYYDVNYEISTAKFQNTDAGYYFQKAIDDNVYLLDKEEGNIVKTFHFDFGSETVPDDVRANIENSVNNGTFSDYTMLYNFAVIGERYICGGLVHNDVYMDFIADRQNEVMYTKDIWNDMDEIFIGYIGNELVSVVYPQSESEFYKLKFMSIPLK